MHIVFKVKSKRVLPQGKALFSLQKKSVFYKIMRILYPYENALWALRPCKAFGRSISASLPNPQTPSPWEGAILMGLPPLDQARMLAVSHTKPLHDAVAQMADDLYGGYAPATPFSENTKVYLQTETPFRGCFSLFLQSATGCENQPVFFALFHFFMDKTCFCSVLYKKSSPPYCFVFTKGALL